MAVNWPLILFSMLVSGGGTVMAAIAWCEYNGKKSEGVTFTSAAGFIFTISGGIMCLACTMLPSVSELGIDFGLMIGMPVGPVLLVALAICSGLHVLSLFHRFGSDQMRKIVATVGAVCGVLLTCLCSYGFAAAKQPEWNTIALSITYAVSIFAAGFFVNLLMMQLFDGKHKEYSPQGKIVMIASIVAGVLAIVTVIISGMSDAIIAQPPGISLLGFSIMAAAAGGMFYWTGANGVVWVGLAATIAIGGCLRMLG